LTFVEALPTANACMNATSACALFAGYWAIRTKRLQLHWKLMATAAVASTFFLAGYVTYHVLLKLQGVDTVHRYEGPGRPYYLVLLTTHTILAVVVLPMILRTMWLSAVKRRFVAHARIARWTFPVWGYVSVTGVLVYVILYRLSGWMA
jgi:putative membrane protein